uniref:Uncharacterized protein n=1 Tax=Pyxicephalus adspersus TaxID=30357 RepID=A0AAV3B070_PYXAD|nr:TPA: hypothetical protein GDO54_007254 [Pyxicephalus adspersus]
MKKDNKYVAALSCFVKWLSQQHKKDFTQKYISLVGGSSSAKRMLNVKYNTRCMDRWLKKRKRNKTKTNLKYITNINEQCWKKRERIEIFF